MGHVSPRLGQLDAEDDRAVMRLERAGHGDRLPRRLRRLAIGVGDSATRARRTAHERAPPVATETVAACQGGAR